MNKEVMMYSNIVYSVQSTEYDFDNMFKQQEAFAEAELGETYFAIKDELEDE